MSTRGGDGRFGLVGALRVLAVLAVLAVLVGGAAVLLVSAGRQAADPGAGGSGPGGAVPPEQPGQTGQPLPSASFRVGTEPAPTAPPVRVCGSSALRGPAEPPEGARVVRPGENLQDLVLEHPDGTTFWLAPGVHTLNPDEFGQVIPKDGNTFLGGPGAVLDGRRTNRYAFTGQARDVTIRHLTIRRFGADMLANNAEGVVNHDSATGWTVSHSSIVDNAGGAVFLGDRGLVRHSCLADNGQYGFQALDSRGSRLVGNEIARNNVADWEVQRPGCGCSGGGKLWDARNVLVRGNWVHDNNGVGVFADTNNRGILIENNLIADNSAEGVLYETSYNALIVRNTFLRNGWGKGPTNPGFPTGAVYLSEAGADPRVDSAFRHTLRVSGNVFVDNWSGVVGWENADRFAGSPNNTSTGYSTLVDPAVANLDTCVPGVIEEEPYFSDCRWRTQRLRVVGNTFRFSPERIPRCRAETGCGYQGLFANWGSSPDWSPYRGPVVQKAIALHQDNRWQDNRYAGPWRFMVRAMGNVVGWEQWRGHFGQDLDSTLRGGADITRRSAPPPG